jgi:hypothetical protein
MGEPLFTAGGSASWKTMEHRGFVVSLEWARRRRKMLAMMVIWPAGLMTSGSVFGVASSGMWAISRNVISEFVGFDRDGKCTGSGSRALYAEALEAMPLLGKDRNDKQAFLALVDTVIRFAPDLVLMPAAPPRVREELKGDAMWDVKATIRDSGKTISEASV